MSLTLLVRPGDYYTVSTVRTARRGIRSGLRSAQKRAAEYFEDDDEDDEGAEEEEQPRPRRAPASPARRRRSQRVSRSRLFTR